MDERVFGHFGFLERSLPLAGRFPSRGVLREDRLAVPPAALREILLNAIMHRDYSSPSGYIAIVIFDDRLEIRSVGRLPDGITPALLAGPHLSKPRNPLLADVFHRIGAVEAWGRGTNRVIEECRAQGLPAPIFEEREGTVVVVFRLSTAASDLRHQVGTKSALSRHQVLVLRKAREPRALMELLAATGRTDRTKFREHVLRPLLDAGLLEMTLPDRPRSSRQRYVTSEAGRGVLSGRGPDAPQA